MLNATDLAPSIEKSRVQVSGLNSQGFTKTGRLPDGFYTLCVDIHESLSHQRVNNPNLSCTQFSLVPLKAPRIISPQKGLVFDSRNRPFFTWIGQSLSRMQNLHYTYHFSLRQIDDKNISHYYRYPISERIYEFQTDLTTYTWGTRGDEPPLIPGKRYGWQVSLRPKAGFPEQSVANEGKSDIWYVDYTLVCLPLTGLRASGMTDTEVDIHWINPLPTPGQQLKLAYRPLGVNQRWQY